MPEIVPTSVTKKAEVSGAPEAPSQLVGTEPDFDPGSPPPASDPEAVERYRDRVLLQRLRHGDERAFMELVKANQDLVFNLLFRMIGDREEALDLSQEVFVAVHAAVGRFRIEARLSTWIFRVAKNHCLNHLKYLGRQKRRVRSTKLDRVPEAVLERAIPSLRPDDEASANETKNMVQLALNELEEDHRLLVVLRDVEGLSYVEIEAITGQPRGTVRSRLHRARSLLAGIITRMERE